MCLQLHLFPVEGVLLVLRIFLLCFLIMVCRLSSCAAITNFHVVLVENFALLVIFRKMFTDEVQELSADVCVTEYIYR